LLIVPMATALLVGQESATYAEEYELYQKAQAETNVSQQKDLALEFVRTYEKSQLDSHIAYIYSQYLNTFREKGQWQQLANAAEEFLRYRPADQTVAGAATEAYQKLGQPQKLIDFGTRLYNQSPNAATAYLVANAYQSMNDTANYQRWAERTLRHAPNNTEMLVALVNSSWAAQDLAKAAEYGERAIKALSNAPSNEQNNKVRAFGYRAVGENAYVLGDMSTALKNFEQAVKLDPSVDFGHFRLGYCYWRSGKLEDAILSFAKAVALSGSSSREARQELYNLLRQRFGNTSNASRYIDDAKKELGIS
jgi:tetratricopeptide (TPR) repeat protein